MTKAYNNIYHKDVSSLIATDIYIRVLPKTKEDFKILEDYTDKYDLTFFDTPLDYEIELEGDYYHDPTIADDQPTWMYGVIKPSYGAPNLQYEKLAELVLAPYNSYLTQEAYRLTGNKHYLFDNITGKMDSCEPECPNYPDCKDNPNLGCGNEHTNPSNSSANNCQSFCPNYPKCLTDSSIGCREIKLPCAYDSPNFPDCLAVEPIPGTPGSSTDIGSIQNNCGCEVSYDARQPAGCIQVEDSQLGIQPVRKVKVIVAFNWFNVKSAYTKNNGCFQFNHSDGNGKVRMWVKFKNERSTIRGIQDWRVWQYFWAIEDPVGTLKNSFNNISVIYGHSNEPNSKALKYWMAATTNNALHEFHDFAAQDGINPPPNDLDITLFSWNGGAAAPMLDDIKKSGGLLSTIPYATSVILGILGATATKAPFVGEVLGIITELLWEYAPDVAVFYGDRANEQTDRVKAMLYHEFAHTSHYSQVGNEYWQKNIAYIVAHGHDPAPYGDGTEGGAQRCAIVEAWAEHIGRTYADRTYGDNHSLGNNNPIFLDIGRHIYVLERFNPDDPDAEFPWIPEGVMHDLIDDNNLNPSLVSDGVAIDNVSGFSIKNCFNALASDVESPTTFKDRIINESLPAGQNADDVDILFEQYGY